MCPIGATLYRVLYIRIFAAGACPQTPSILAVKCTKLHVIHSVDVQQLRKSYLAQK